MIEPNERLRHIRTRLAKFKTTGDPNELWPDVPRRQRIGAQRRILAATNHVLNPMDRPAALSVEPGMTTRALAVASHVLGVASLLGYWHERGRLDADGGVGSFLTMELERGRRRADIIHQRFAAILDSCNRRAIIPIVLKGVFTGSVYFPDRGTRPISDIDLLVVPAAKPEVAAVLRAHGLEETELGPGQGTWRPRSQPAVVKSLDHEHEDNPWSVDLHTHIDRRYFWKMWSTLGERPHRTSREWQYEGYKARILGQPLLTAYLAQHAVHDFRSIRLIRLVELAFVLARDIGTNDCTWDGLAAVLNDTHTARFAFPAFQLCAWLAPRVVDPAFVQELGTLATPRMRRVVDRWWSVGVGVDDAGSWDERLMWARTPTEELRNIAFQLVRRAMARIAPASVPRLRWQLYRLLQFRRTDRTSGHSK